MQCDTRQAGSWSVVSVHPDLGEHPYRFGVSEQDARAALAQVSDANGEPQQRAPAASVQRVELRESGELRAWVSLGPNAR
jgi:hypothetical protein